LPGLASNFVHPELCLFHSYDYRPDPYWHSTLVFETGSFM
jgi:hypothetical protein